ncbi:MAG: endonuclease III [Victivallaceae bacterium]|nr:endonuclease III [Victivallaceae bacterium]
MRKSEKLKFIYDRLKELYGIPECPLKHETAFQLLTAVVLSAQCTDVRVNLVTPELFAKYGTPEKMAAAAPEEIAGVIRSVGLYQTKSRSLHGLAAMIVERFGGEVPRTMAELLMLPGVGRKSANVLLGNAFGIPGFPADTHVQRLLTRLGVASKRDPVMAEREVCKNLAPEYWTDFSHLLITHGRRCCSARNPECGRCPLRQECKFER